MQKNTIQPTQRTPGGHGSLSRKSKPRQYYISVSMSTLAGTSHNFIHIFSEPSRGGILITFDSPLSSGRETACRPPPRLPLPRIINKRHNKYDARGRVHCSWYAGKIEAETNDTSRLQLGCETTLFLDDTTHPSSRLKTYQVEVGANERPLARFINHQLSTGGGKLRNNLPARFSSHQNPDKKKDALTSLASQSAEAVAVPHPGCSNTTPVRLCRAMQGYEGELRG